MDAIRHMRAVWAGIVLSTPVLVLALRGCGSSDNHSANTTESDSGAGLKRRQIPRQPHPMLDSMQCTADQFLNKKRLRDAHHMVLSCARRLGAVPGQEPN